MTRAVAIYRRPERPPHREETWLADDRDRVWMADGACRNYDPELFFPIKRTPDKVAAICWNCPVMVRCLDYAWANGILHGIWGGMAADARFNWKRRGVPPRSLPDHALAKLRASVATNEDDNQLKTVEQVNPR